MKAKVTAKGQVTIPQALRRKFNIVVGDELEFNTDGPYLRMTKRVNEKQMRSTMGNLKKKIRSNVSELLTESRGKVDLPFRS